MRLRVWLQLAVLARAVPDRIRLSNTALPVDLSGRPITTGEASVLLAPDGYYYFYFNNWGECFCGAQYPWLEGCCASRTCVYGGNHSVLVYRTDLRAWDYRGVALSTQARQPGTIFRPAVVYNQRTRQYVMWYENRHPGQVGYAVAVADNPAGPFRTVVNGTGQTGGKIGDHSIMVDEDGRAYQVRTGNIIQQLSDDYLHVQGNASSFSPPPSIRYGTEGPVFFKHAGSYYITLGSGCCACKGGSTVLVFRAPSPLGPFSFQADIGTIPGTSGNATTCSQQRGRPGLPGCVYAWRAQATASFTVGNTTLLLGNQWQTSGEPPGTGPRNRDLLYFAPLSFKDDGSIVQLEYQERITLP